MEKSNFIDENQLEFEKKFSEHVKDNTCNGECQICGSCCGNGLGLNMDDFIRLKNYVISNNIQPSPPRKLIGSDGKEMDSCPFLGEDNKCKVYEARPTICRKFICNAREMYYRYDDDGKLVQNEMGQIDIRQTFFPTLKK